MIKTPVYTWIGLAIILGGQALLAAGSSFMATWLTPVMWTGLILLLDGIVYRMSGRSWLMTRRREFPLLILASVAVWLIFEAYNLHLRNWRYEGLPDSSLVRDLGYFWSFATIIPGVFEIVDLVQALIDRAVKPRNVPRSMVPAGPSWAWWLAGVAMITIPLALPASAAAYLFGAVWIGFFLLLDPLNENLGLPSLRQQWRRGSRHKIWALLLGGLICGLVWETWNQQAVAAAIKLRTLVDRVRGAPRGYAGFFDAVRINQDELDGLYQYDIKLLESAARVAEAVDGLEAAMGNADEVPVAIQNLVSVAGRALRAYDRRIEVVRSEQES